MEGQGEEQSKETVWNDSRPSPNHDAGREGWATSWEKRREKTWQTINAVDVTAAECPARTGVQGKGFAK